MATTLKFFTFNFKNTTSDFTPSESVRTRSATPESGARSDFTRNSIGGFGSSLPPPTVVVVKVPDGVDVVVEPVVGVPGTVVVVVVDDVEDEPGAVVEVVLEAGVPGTVLDVVVVVVVDVDESSVAVVVVVVGSGQKSAAQLIVVVVVKNTRAVELGATVVDELTAAAATSPTHTMTCEIDLSPSVPPP